MGEAICSWTSISSLSISLFRFSSVKMTPKHPSCAGPPWGHAVVPPRPTTTSSRATGSRSEGAERERATSAPWRLGSANHPRLCGQGQDSDAVDDSSRPSCSGTSVRKRGGLTWRRRGKTTWGPVLVLLPRLVWGQEASEAGSPGTPGPSPLYRPREARRAVTHYAPERYRPGSRAFYNIMTAASLQFAKVSQSALNV